MIRRDKIYRFTNENVFSYQLLYHFSNANILSVLGSGDQYFSSLLYGAKSIEVYDVNPLSWDFFVLKFYGMQTMSFEEFYEYFVEKSMNDWYYFEKLCEYMPEDVSKRFHDLLRYYPFLSTLIKEDSGCNFADSIIPYFNKEKYYQLQELLKNRTLPTFYLEDFANLPSQLSDKKYDIILASNVNHYIYSENELNKIAEFKELISHFHCPEIQASYCWGRNERNLKAFLKAYEEWGFDIDEIDSAEKSRATKDYVISLRR